MSSEPQRTEVFWPPKTARRTLSGRMGWRTHANIPPFRVGSTNLGQTCHLVMIDKYFSSYAVYDLVHQLHLLQSEVCLVG